MKKFILLSSALILLMSSMFSVLSQHKIVPDPIRTDGVISVQDISPAVATTHPIAARAVARGEKPGEFTGVSYRYARNVKALSPVEKNQLVMKQDGILEIPGKNIFVPHPDTIYVDPQSDLVFQAETVSDKQMLMLRPTLSSVFEDIEIPQQEVKLTLANTVSLVEGIVAGATQTNNMYAVNLQFDSVSFLLDTAKNGSLSATLVGQIILTNPRVEGKYSKNGGYQLVFKTSEQIDLKVYTTVKAKKEIKKPLWGTEIKAGDLGKCEIGLFLLINMEGEVTLAFEIHQGIDLTLGAKGGTFYYIPTSITNISNVEHWCDINYSVHAKMKAFGGLQCTANLKIKSYNALDVYVNGGMEGTVDTDGNILNADIGFRIKAGGKIISKKFTLIDEYYSLWKLQQPDYKGYKMLVHEACAYSDYVVGEIHTISDNQTDPGKKDTVPYQGALKVLVKHPNNQINEFSAQTNEKGIFAVLNIPLKKGDQVMVKLPDVSSPGPAVPATIPFKEISLYAADYYAGVATGSVAGTRSEWSRLVNQQAKGQTPANVKAIAQSTPATNLKGMMPASQMAERFKEFRNNLTVYRGPVEFITQTSAPAKAVLVSPGVRNLSGGETEKVKTNRGNVNNPLGMFTIEGLVFEPGQKVKARIEVEGFIIESEWIETEGLLVSEIEHEQFQFTTGIRNENYSTQNSFIVVSSLRSQTAPAGKVQLLKGADVPHGSVTGFQSVSEFMDAKKAKLWFNQTVDLKPLENYPGSAIAETGPWNATVEYSSPGDVINPLKNRKHPFELVSYQYKNQDLGYKVFINQCASCTSPANVVEKLGGTQKSGIPVQHQQQKAPAPREAPVLTPKVNPGKMR